MSSGPLSVPGAKPTLFLSLAMSIVGMAGVYAGWGRTRPLGDPPIALSEVRWEFITEVFASDLQRGLAVANMIASTLLVLAGFMLTARRRTALWWATQALWANVGYAVASVAGMSYLLWLHAPMLATGGVDPTPGDPFTTPPESFAWAQIVGVLFSNAVMLLVYALLFRLRGRETVQEFVLRKRED